MPKLPSSRVALSFESSLLSTFLKGSSWAALPLRTKDVDIPYFVQNFLLALLAYMESAATHLTLTFISFCYIRIQSFKRIPSLNALNERCSMNDMPSICILLTFAPYSLCIPSLWLRSFSRSLIIRRLSIFVLEALLFLFLQ